jgi:hypothetical protein
MKRPRRAPPVVVHLGNAGFSSDSKTLRCARKFPGINFIGIDLIDTPPEKKPENWTQIRAEFMEGLEMLKDGSISVISSEMALGYYDPKTTSVYDSKARDYEEHTHRVIALAFRKLKAGGKLHIAADARVVDNIIDAVKAAGFKCVEKHPMTMRGRRRTHWLKVISINTVNAKYFQISAVK